MTRVPTRSSADSGAILPLLAVLAFALLALIAFFVNTGWLAFKKSEAQTAVDAAAMAAAAALPDFNRSGNPAAVATLAAGFNGPPTQNRANLVIGQDPDIQLADLQFLSYSDSSGGVPALDAQSANAVRVTKSYTIPHFLAPFLGNNLSTTTTVRATALLGSPECMVPRLPFAILECDLGNPPQPNDQCLAACSGGVVQREVRFSPAPVDNGAWFIFDPNAGNNTPANAAACKDAVTYTTPIPELCVGSFISLNNGQLTSCLSALDNWCDQRDAQGQPVSNPQPPQYPAAPCSEATPWEAYVPVIACADLPPSNQPNQVVRVSGFAKVAITNVVNQGNQKKIVYHLRCETLPAAEGAGFSCGLRGDRPVLVQ